MITVRCHDRPSNRLMCPSIKDTRDGKSLKSRASVGNPTSSSIDFVHSIWYNGVRRPEPCPFPFFVFSSLFPHSVTDDDPHTPAIYRVTGSKSGNTHATAHVASLLSDKTLT